MSLIGTIWLQCTSGTNSNFPAYSSQLKQVLSLSQLQLNNLALASDAGKLLGWFSGIAAVYLPLWVVLMIGASLGFIGYGVQYLFIANRIPSLAYWHIFLLTSLAGNSICWINTVSYIIAIQNFPLDRQIAVGLSTSYQGLTAKVFTGIVNMVVGNSSSSDHTERAKTYLLLNATVPLLVSFVAAPVVRNVQIGKTKKLESGFKLMFFITMATGIYAVISSLDSIVGSLPPVVLVIGMGVFLLVPLAVPVAEKLREMQQKKCWLRRAPSSRVCNVNTADQYLDSDNNNIVDDVVRVEIRSSLESSDQQKETFEVRVKEEIGATAMLRRIEFWLYFFVYLFGVTLGLVYMNNLGQIVESLGSSRTSALVSLSSSFVFFGRLIPSLLDYYFSKTGYIVSRPASMAAMMIPMSGAFFLLLITESNLSLTLSTAIIGICTGGITSISVPTTTELFGSKNFGVNHNILVTNIPVGSFLFGDSAALLYNANSSYDGSCIGTKCYKTTFAIWGSLCLFGVILAVILHLRTKKFYSPK